MKPNKKPTFKFRPGGENYKISYKEERFISKLITESPRLVTFETLQVYCFCGRDYIRKIASNLRPIITHEGLVLDNVTDQGYRIGKFEAYK